MTPLPTLKARLEEATGPDRELDCLIAVEIDGFILDDEGRYCFTDSDGVLVTPGNAKDMNVKKYTASVDAALELVERILSKGEVELYIPVPQSKRDCHVVIDQGPKKYKSARAPTTPLAILMALVSALEGEKS